MREVQLPLGGTAEVRGMKGREEDLLSNEKLVRSGEAMELLLAGCTSRLRELTEETEGRGIRTADTEALLSPDRVALLLAIRAETYGDTVECELQCAERSCREKFAVDVDLSEISSKPAKGEGPYTATLSDGTVVKFDFMTGKREKALARMKTNVATAALEARVKDVSGTHRNDIRRWLEDVSAGLRNELRNKMEELDCGPEVIATAECPTCGEEVQFVIPEQRGFFFPGT
jgi:hypothetical protein